MSDSNASGRSYTHSAGLFVMSATTNPSFAQSFVWCRELDCFKRSSFRRRVGSRILAGFKRVSFRPACVVLSGNGQNSGRSIQTQTSYSVRSLSEQRPLRPFYAISILPFAPTAFATVLQGFREAVGAECRDYTIQYSDHIPVPLLPCYPTTRFQWSQGDRVQEFSAFVL